MTWEKVNTDALKGASLRDVARRPTGALALSYRDVTREIGLCRRTIEKLIGAGEFPAPRRVGARLIFVGAEVHAWLNDQPTKMRYLLKILKPNCGTPERETFDNFSDAKDDVVHLINSAIERCTNTDDVEAWLLELEDVETATPTKGFHVTVDERTYICRELGAK